MIHPGETKTIKIKYETTDKTGHQTNQLGHITADEPVANVDQTRARATIISTNVRADLELKKCSIAQQTQEIQKLNTQKTFLEGKLLQARSQVSSLEHEKKFLLQDKKRLEQNLQKLQINSETK